MGERGGTTRKRGHQYHPQQMGQRRSNIPSSEVISALHGEKWSELVHMNLNNPIATTPSSPTTATPTPITTTTTTTSYDNDETANSQHYLVNVPLNVTNVDNRIDGSTSARRPNTDESALNKHKNQERRSPNDDEVSKPSKQSKLQSTHRTSSKSSRSSDHHRRKANVLQNVQNIPKDDRHQPMDDNNDDDDGIGGDDIFEIENDPEAAEWSKLRCTSERTEDVAEREHRRQRRCADYPGLAFGRSIFSSDTMMKFNIIRNELHNIMKTQLKRVGFLNFPFHDRIFASFSRLRRFSGGGEGFGREFISNNVFRVVCFPQQLNFSQLFFLKNCSPFCVLENGKNNFRTHILT